jgi:hypothetical protein
MLRGHTLGLLTVSLITVKTVGLSPNTQPGGPVHRFYDPGTGWTIYTPRHRVLILIAFFDLHVLQWDYSFPGHHTGNTGNTGNNVDLLLSTPGRCMWEYRYLSVRSKSRH